jgi:hypothetical protein
MEPDTFSSEIYDKSEKAKSGLYYGIIILTSISILLGIFGILLLRYQNWCSLGLFSCFSLIISIILLTVGISLLILRTGATNYID